MRRRSLLKSAGLVTVAALPGAACASDDDAIEVFVQWSGGELEAFRRTIDDFTSKSHRKVRLVPVGEQVRELLRARFSANNPPDIAIVPLPGLIREYAHAKRVVELDAALATDIPTSLNTTVTVKGGLYGLWIKAAHKSLFWYRPSALRAGGMGNPPATWADLITFLRAEAKAGRPPLSIGAADGWVLTDWFENVLAGVDQGLTYRLLADNVVGAWDSVVVTSALEHLAEAWAIRDIFPNGAARALTSQWEDSVYEVFAQRTSAMMFEGDFVGAVLGRLKDADRLGEEPGYFRFPAIHGLPPLVVGGDVAARFTHSPGGAELLEWLSKPESLKGRVGQSGFLSPNRKMPLDAYREGRDRELARQFQKAEAPLFDLSDQLDGRLSAGQGRGLSRILTEFFQDVTRPGTVTADAVRTAQGRMSDAAKGRA